MTEILSIKCTDCGAAVTVEDAGDDAAMVVCPNCGRHFGTWGDVKQAARDIAVERATRDLGL